jgi:hypothetical protein
MTNRMLVCVVLSTVGCGGSTNPPNERTEAPSEPTVYRTVVRFDNNGTPHSQVFELTAADLAREAEPQARSARSVSTDITQDSSCAGASLWLYDADHCPFAQPNAVNQICFIGVGTAWLADYQRRFCTKTTCFFPSWVGAVRSYWPGDQGGSILGQQGDLFGGEPFHAFGPCTTAGYWASRAIEVTMQ